MIKPKLLLLSFALSSVFNTYSQTGIVQISFTANADGNYLPLDSVSIKNISQNFDTTLSCPDTVLVADITTGWTELQNNDDFLFSNNYPNPFNSNTYFEVSIPEKGRLIISVYDLSGKDIISSSENYLAGNHKFSYYSASKGLYLIKVSYKDRFQTKKISCLNNDYTGDTRISYLGRSNSNRPKESQKSSKNASFFIGDELECTGFSNFLSDVVTFNINQDTTITFMFNSAAFIPIADFIADDTIGFPSFVVNFTNLSQNNPTSCFWDFGDGNTSNQFHPYNIYNTFGLYSVSLIASNAYGSDTLIKHSYISVGIPPVANFIADPTSGQYPLSVSFTDLSTYGPTNWLWNFGDGNTSTLQNPVHTYTADGIYSVYLEASNVFGYDTLIKSNYISVSSLPIVEFTANPKIGGVPLNVNFIDLTINNPVGWTWDFGDGSISVLQNPTHTYDSVGNYTVSLTAINANGSDTLTKVDFITVGVLPVVDFTANPINGLSPLTVNFIDLSSNNPNNWQWNFGDGNYSSQQNPSHTYMADGNYTVSLSASNAYGSDSDIKSNYILVGPSPIAAFTANPTTGAAPLNVSFTDLSTNNPTNWHWSFGDGDTSSQQNPSHIYNNVGNFTVSLISTNTYGSDTTIKVDFIIIGLSPIAAFSANPTNGIVPLTVIFTDLSQNNPTSWYWDFGDGNSSTVQNPSHTYTKKGNYTVYFAATNSYGTDSDISLDLISVGALPTADFSVQEAVGYDTLLVHFTDITSNSPTSWLWNFGDGSTSTQQNPTHLYNSYGRFSVTLHVDNSFGVDSIVKPKLIVVDSCPSFFIDTRDNNVYSAVTIGTQCWMSENLAYLPSVFPSNSSSYLFPRYYVYDYQGNDVSTAKTTTNYQTYGVLYNWIGAMDYLASSNSVPSGVLGVCPYGWHLPSDQEWKMLEGQADSQYGYPSSEWGQTGFRGWDAGGNLKDTLTTYWSPPNFLASNSVGFSALPGGNRNNMFEKLTQYGLFWTSTEYNTYWKWYRSISYQNQYVYREYIGQELGFSVRCIKDSCTYYPTSNAGSDTLNIVGDSITLNGNTPLNGNGLWTIYLGTGGSFSDPQNPSTTFYGMQGVSYHLIWTVENDCGISYDTVVIHFSATYPNCGIIVDSRDGNVYNTVQIGSQCWMQENLAYLPSVSPSSVGSTINPYYYVYGYQGSDVNAAKASINYQTYGVLYNWPAAMDSSTGSNSVPSGVQGVCPDNWHFPSDEEWKILEGEVDSYYNYPSNEWNDFGDRGTDAGGNLKETGIIHWHSPNTGATNISGFTALPAGYKPYTGNNFYELTISAYFATTTEHGSLEVINRKLESGKALVYRSGSFSKKIGFSVRCVKD